MDDPKVEVHGTLKKAQKVKLFGTAVVVGFIYGDTKMRFEDGKFVHTSRVKRIDGNIVYTRNSIYRAEWATEDEIKEMQQRSTSIGATAPVQ